MRRRTIGILAQLGSGPFFGAVINGIAGVVQPRGVQLLVVQTVDGRAGNVHLEVPEVFPAIGWDRVDGFIVVGNAARIGYLRCLHDTGKPMVIVCSEFENFPCPTVGPDNASGVRSAVQDLIAHGHRRIAFVGSLRNVDFRERYEAYRDTLLAAGIEPEDDLHYDTEGYLDLNGVVAGRRMIEDGLPSTATVAGNDALAFGVMAALEKAGYRLPEDQAMVGFDDTEASAAAQLSTVTQHIGQLGVRAAELILPALNGAHIGTADHRLPTVYLSRRSCGCVGFPTVPPAPSSAGRELFRAALAPTFALDSTGAQALERLVDLYDGTARPRREAPVGAGAEASSVGPVQELPSARPLPAEGPAVAQPTRQEIDTFAAAVQLVYAADPRPETLGIFLVAVQGYRRAVELGEPDAAGTGTTRRTDLAEGLLVTALSRAISQHAGDVVLRLQDMVRHGLAISLELLRGPSDGLESLSWLEGTTARAAAIGLWRRGTNTLDLISVFGKGLDSIDPAEPIPAEQFPPPEMIAATAGTSDLTFVLPLRTWTRDWGLFAVTGPTDTDTPTGRETYFHWGAMLGVALDHRSMVRSLRERQSDLAAAYQRERGLVENIRISEQRYALAAESANDGLWDWDLDADEIYYAPRWKSLLGLVGQEVGRSPQEWLSRVHPADLPQLQAALEASRSRHLPLEIEHRMQAADGSHRWMHARALAVPGEGGAAIRLVGSLTDITERKELEERLRRQALYDALTGLPNRALFFDRLERAIVQLQRNLDLGFAVLFLDLDGFKVVNDSLGHSVGDLLLEQVAGRLRQHLRTGDTAARFGGDEFAILLAGVRDVGTVLRTVRRLQTSLSEPYDLAGHHVVVNASVGIAMSSPDYRHPEEILRDSDIAMYRAKGQERGGFAIFDPSMHARAVNRLRVESELRRAIETGELEAHYQPIVRVETGEVAALEALVRWRHPERGLVAPGEFLPVAEETGLVVPLGRRMFRDVCGDLAGWKSGGLLPETARISVNVSNREFWQKDLLENLDTMLSETGTPAEWLTLEITEGVVMGNADQAARTLEQLHARGLHLHIDDFGTGYSSLEVLHRFPIHALKIDRSFVLRLDGEKSSRELVRTIAQMGRNLGLEVIAEGIENARSAEILRELGCPFAQGYWFGRPVSAAETGLVLREPCLPAGRSRLPAG